MIDTDEMERLARALAGGWRVEQGVLPVVVLTLLEAQALERRLSKLNELAATLGYLADEGNWLGNPHSHHALLHGHDTPLEMAQRVLGLDKCSGDDTLTRYKLALLRIRDTSNSHEDAQLIASDALSDGKDSQ